MNTIEEIQENQEIIKIKPKNKGGRPKGSIIENAICRNPELKKLQKKQNNEDWKTTKSYIKTKIHSMEKRYNMERMDLKDMTEEQLNEILVKMKVKNVMNKPVKPLAQKAPRKKFN